MDKILSGKTFVLMGIATKKSIAYGCYQQIKENGGKVIVTYPNDRIKKNIVKFLPGDDELVECDVSKVENVKEAFAEIGKKHQCINGVIHSIAFAPSTSFANDFLNTSLEDWNLSMNISAYSLISVSRYASYLMEEKGGSIIALTFLGSTRAIPNYNVMGVCKAALEANVRYLAADLGQKNIRVNSISAGAQKTLALSGVKDSSKFVKEASKISVTGKGISNNEVGGTAVYLMSDLSKGVTGDNIYVDNGVHLRL